MSRNTEANRHMSLPRHFKLWSRLQSQYEDTSYVRSDRAMAVCEELVRYSFEGYDLRENNDNP